jgi:hypothetical protein
MAEGIPTRCFTLRSADGQAQMKICVWHGVWPLWYTPAWPKHPGPDPGPLVEIEGVSPALMQELQALDAINQLATRLAGETARLVQEAVVHGVKAIQRQLPPQISID